MVAKPNAIFAKSNFLILPILLMELTNDKSETALYLRQVRNPLLDSHQEASSHDVILLVARENAVQKHGTVGLARDKIEIYWLDAPGITVMWWTASAELRELITNYGDRITATVHLIAQARRDVKQSRIPAFAGLTVKGGQEAGTQRAGMEHAPSSDYGDRITVTRITVTVHLIALPRRDFK